MGRAEVSFAGDKQGAPLALNVLSVGRGVAAAFALRNLADLGASGSWWRWGPARPGDWPPDEHFLSYFTAGIEVVDEHRPLPAVLDAAERLAGHFDVVLTDFGAAEQAEGELFARLSAVNPALVVGVADHFGRTGPYARWAGDELTDYAMGGYWGFGGHPEREPLRVPGYQAQLHAGLALSVAVLRHRVDARRALGRHRDLDPRRHCGRARRPRPVPRDRRVRLLLPGRLVPGADDADRPPRPRR
jgi:crotonobetainyl-CoA:carnitine CoA-transferase CaiB-like acyl-CoA transferase